MVFICSFSYLSIKLGCVFCILFAFDVKTLFVQQLVRCPSRPKTTNETSERKPAKRRWTRTGLAASHDDYDGWQWLRDQIEIMEKRAIARLPSSAFAPKKKFKKYELFSDSETSESGDDSDSEPDSPPGAIPPPEVEDMPVDLDDFHREMEDARAAVDPNEVFYTKPLGGEWCAVNNDLRGWDRYACLVRRGPGLRFCESTRWPKSKTWARTRYSDYGCKMLARHFARRSNHFFAGWRASGEDSAWAHGAIDDSVPADMEFLEWVRGLDVESWEFQAVSEINAMRP